MDWMWKNKGQEVVETFVTLCWQVWRARNEAIFKGILDPPGLCHRKALDWLKEYQQASFYELGEAPVSHMSVLWCRPSVGVIKINVDGAFSLTHDKHGLG